MFIGSIPAPLASIVHEHTSRWETDAVHVLCSGNLTIERALDRRFALHSNDVSIYTTALGTWLAGRDMPLAVREDRRDEFGWLGDDGYLSSPVAKAATVMLGTRAFVGIGRANAFYERQRRGYREQWPGLHAATVEKLERVDLRLASYTACDASEFIHTVPLDGAVCSFPPFYCLSPGERILTADLRWVRCGDLRAGDAILAFDEYPRDGQRCRRWRFGTVTRSERGVAECVRVRLDDGRSVICTRDHPWLATNRGTGPTDRARWVTAERLLEEAPYVVRLLEPWESEATFDAGWLSLGNPRVRVTAVEPIGPHPIQSLSTSTRTYVGEGFAHHNTGGYESLYAPLEAVLAWDEPEYEVMDRDGLHALLDAMRERKHWLYGTDHRIAGHEKWLRGIVQVTSRNVPVFVYGSGGRTRWTGPSQTVEGVRAPRLRPGQTIGGRLALAKLTAGQFNALRAFYLDPRIAPATAMLPLAVLADGVIIGVIGLNRPNYGRAGAYLLSDFAVGPTDYPRLSKLVLMAALSRETQALIERTLSHRVRSIVTTAFSDRPVSMKYRGLFRMVKRTETPEGPRRYQLQYEAPAGQWTLAEALATWRDKHGQQHA